MTAARKAAMATAASGGRPWRGVRRAGVAAALAAALVGGACAQEADGPDAATGGDLGEFAATSEYLADVAEATEGLSYRMSMDMTMSVDAEGEGMEVGGRFMTGEVDGDLSAMTMDMGELFRDIADDAPADEAFPEAFLDADLTIEMVTDGTTLYMRAPFLEAMADLGLDSGASRADLGPLADLGSLGGEWGRIDLSQLSISEIASATGAQTTDPRAFLEMAARATDVQELGTDTIGGTEVRGLGATITYGDMIEAQGLDADDVRDQMTGGAGTDDAEFDETSDAVLEAMFAAEMPVEVWVDDDDRVRRVAMDLNMTEIMAGVAELEGEDLGDFAMSMTMAMDFSDYGAESIEIDVPDDAVDITDEYLALIEGGGVGGPAIGST